MAWVFKSLTRGGVNFVNDQYDAEASVYNSPMAYWLGMSLDDHEHNIDAHFPVEYSGEVGALMEIFDDPKWDKDPWALALVFADGFSEEWKKRENVIHGILQNRKNFDGDWRAAMKNKEDVEEMGYGWYRTYVLPLYHYLYKMFRGAKYSVAQREYVSDSFIFAGTRLLEFVKDEPELHDMLQNFLAYAIGRSL